MSPAEAQNAPSVIHDYFGILWYIHPVKKNRHFHLILALLLLTGSFHPGRIFADDRPLSLHLEEVALLRGPDLQFLLPVEPDSHLLARDRPQRELIQFSIDIGEAVFQERGVVNAWRREQQAGAGELRGTFFIRAQPFSNRLSISYVAVIGRNFSMADVLEQGISGLIPQVSSAMRIENRTVIGSVDIPYGSVLFEAVASFLLIPNSLEVAATFTVGPRFEFR